MNAAPFKSHFTLATLDQVFASESKLTEGCMSQPEKKPQPPIQWSFPPATGPVPWTPGQLRAHKHQQLEQAGEALL